MPSLVHQRGRVRGALTHYQKQVATFDKDTPYGELKTVLKKVLELPEKFQLLQQQIVVAAKDESETEKHEDFALQFELDFGEVEGRLNGLLEPSAPSTVSETNSKDSASATKHANVVKMPKIDLPKFSGNFREWMSFADLFTSMLKGQQGLSNAQRMQYLKSSVEGEAAKAIQHLIINDTSYDEAWTILTKRYDVPSQIAIAHMASIFDVKPAASGTADQLLELLDTVKQNAVALRAMNHEIGDLVLVYAIISRVDTATRQLWEMEHRGSHVATFAEVDDFLYSRVRSLRNTPGNSHSKEQNKNRTGKPNQQASKSTPRNAVQSYAVTERGQAPCLKCQQTHPLWKCSVFHGLSVTDRKSFAFQNKLCCNCLRVGHFAKDCTSGSCKKCETKHHTLLHLGVENSHGSWGQRSGSNAEGGAASVLSATAPSFQTTSSSLQTLHSGSQQGAQGQVLLKTASILVQDDNHALIPCRALIDGGSQTNMITEAAARRLRLPITPHDSQISGIGGLNGPKSSGTVTVTLQSRVGPYQANCVMLVVPHIAGPLPTYSVDRSMMADLRKLTLADPAFHTPGDIDLLLDVTMEGDILLDGRSRLTGGPLLQNSRLGWIVAGRILQQPPPKTSAFVGLLTADIDAQLRKFWELEEVPVATKWTPTEQRCEDKYQATTIRDSDGRYTVHYPFYQEDAARLGRSRQQVQAQFLQTERRLLRDEGLRTAYTEFIEEYETLGHLELIPTPEINNAQHAITYLPHHPVLKPNSSTTKVRVVFNASAKTSSGTSLNDILWVGPTLQANLVDTLLRFRIHPVAMTADIEKMFRQVKIYKPHQDLQRILWRTDPSQPIRDYRLTTVTYGTSAAPYLAVRSLHQLAKDEAMKFPEAAIAVLQDMYMDDLLTGAEDEKSAITLSHQLQGMMSSGALHLRKWASNSQTVMASIPESDREVQPTLSIGDSEETVSTLGIRWTPGWDHFTVSVPTFKDEKITKRSLLSQASKVFDPAGWFAPVTILGKILMQRLWAAGIQWDDAVPDDVRDLWLELRRQLPDLADLHIPRHLGTTPDQQVHLHGFADASEKAMCAVVYLQTFDDTGQVRAIRLIAARTRVAPLRQVSILRLELCAAALLTKLLSWCINTLKLPDSPVTAYSDSTVVLAWLADVPRRWKMFVANRVSLIQETLPRQFWKHVRSPENPADLGSRGTLPGHLKDSPLWCYGPEFLCQRSTPCAPDSLSDHHVESGNETNSIAGSNTHMGLFSTHSVFDTSAFEACFRLLHQIREKLSSAYQ